MTEATTSNYWIGENALTITLNAMGEKDHIQCSVTGGAVIMCFMRDIDGLSYDSGHNYRRWPLTTVPTYFNTYTRKYVYVAIPRSSDVGSNAIVVFPDQKLDLYGMTEPAEGEEQGTQVGSPDYYYIWLQGIITSSRNSEGADQMRDWEQQIDFGSLSTDQAVAEQTGEWYRWLPDDNIVTFLKRIVMSPDSWFQNLRLGSSSANLTGVATASTGDEYVNSTDLVTTPSYVNGKFLSKTHADTAAGRITFNDGLTALANALFGNYLRGETNSGAAILPNGTGDFLNLKVIQKVLGNLTVEQTMEAVNVIFSGLLRSRDSKGNLAREGFENGSGIYMDANQGLIQTDGLEVRGFMRVMELIINRLQLMESDYSFTEGDTITHIDYEDSGQTLVLTMDKEHDTDYTPFYPGDIIYAKINDLLPAGSAVPDGHTSRKGGSYYTSWMWVESVDLENNQLRVHLYPGLKQSGDPYVPGAKNFSPHGTILPDSDVSAEMLTEFSEVGTVDPDDATKATGYDCRIAITRHGNRADSSDEHIRQSQLGRQQSWVLSTTDQRITYFWRVDEPIVSDDNYALCLGILPQLDCLPYDSNGNPIWNVDMPSLFVNTVFYSHQHKINWPARIVKEDRGSWVSNPTVEYTGPTGTRTPDGTLDAAVAASLGWTGTSAMTFTQGEQISEPYHYQHITRNRWITLRLSAANNSLSDATLYKKMTQEWTEENDLETSRTWNNGALWEAMVDNPTDEPSETSVQWQLITDATGTPGAPGKDGRDASLAYCMPEVVSIPTDKDGKVLGDFSQEVNIYIRTSGGDLSASNVSIKEGGDNITLMDGGFVGHEDGAITFNNETAIIANGAFSGETLVMEDYSATLVSARVLVTAKKGDVLNEHTCQFNVSGVDSDLVTYAAIAQLNLVRSVWGEGGNSPVNVYSWSQSNTDAPAISGTAYPPAGWTKRITDQPGDDYFLWMAESVMHADGTIDAWGIPVCLSGADGDPGADASGQEFIYLRLDTYPFPTTQTKPANINVGEVSPEGTANGTETDKQKNDWVPNGWSDRALPADENNKYVYESQRRKSAGNNQQWGAFCEPYLRSNWGVRGVDGDGVQYVFKLFDHELTDAERTSNIPTKPASQNANGEWIPTGWSDDPQSPTKALPFCYCSTIREINGTWGTFSKLGLWSTFTESITKKSETAYYIKNSTGTRPAENDPSWSTTKPTLNAGEWLFTKTVITWSDDSTTILYTDERNPNDGIAGQDIIVDGATVMKYYVGNTNTTHPADTSSDWKDLSQVTQTQGKWLWSQATTYYRKASSAAGSHDAGTSYNYNVSYISKDGTNGRGIKSSTELYQATNSSASRQKPTSDSGWSTDPNLSDLTNKWTETYKYLWNCEKVVYTEANGSETTEYSTPRVIAIWTKDGAAGRGIDSIVNYYAVSASADTAPVSGWDDNPVAPTEEAPYLWNYERINWTTGTPSYTDTDPHVIGHYGADGDDVAVAVCMPAVVSIPTDRNGVVLEDFDATVAVQIYTASEDLGGANVTIDAGGTNVTIENGSVISRTDNGITFSGETAIVSNGEFQGETLVLDDSDVVISSGALRITAKKGSTLTEHVCELTVSGYDTANTRYTAKTSLNIQRNVKGNGIEQTDRTYNISAQATTASDTTAPSDIDTWLTQSPAVTEEKPYLWMREITTYTDQTVITRYLMQGAMGQNGIDAQDCEWVYVRTTENVAPTIVDDGTDGYLSDDFLPLAKVTSGRIKGGTEGDANVNVRCTDDPKGVDSTWRYEWEIKRTKGNADGNGHRSWQKYSGTMTIHNNFVENGVRIDLDNQADLVSLDSDGKVRFARTITTHARIYDGSAVATTGVTNTTTDSLVIGGCTPTVSLANGILTITWAFTKGMAAAVADKTIKLTYKNTEYQAKFSLGTTDRDAIWQVMPKPSEVSFARNTTTNALTPDSQVLKCGYTKATGSGTESVDEAVTASGQITHNSKASGMYLYYRQRTNNTWGTTWTAYPSAGITVANSTTVQDYEFCITNGPIANDESNIEDREGVPVMKDGAEGDGIVSVTRTYARSTQSTSTNDSTAPTGIDVSVGTSGWAASSPAVTEAYPYLWAREVVDYKFKADTIKYYMIGAMGQNGIDAQDVEWVFIRTKTNIPPVISGDDTYTDHNGKAYTADDHLPKVVAGTGGSLSDIESDNSGSASKLYECTDDPKGVDSTWKYEWEIKREKGTATNGHRSWTAYSGTMTIHNQMPVSISSANVWYALDDSGTTAPADSVFDDAQTGFDDFPPLNSGKYIWQATKITDSNGATSYTGKMCLGKTSDFLEGTEVYAVSASNSQTPTSWATTYNKEKGKYLWTATRVKYTNKTTYDYLNPKCIGYFGEDGTSPYFADIDNEMVSVACDYNGNTTAAFDKTVNVGMWHGSVAQALTALSTTSHTNFTITPSQSGKTVRVQIAQGVQIAQVTDITITIACENSGNKTLHLYVNGVRPGSPGEKAVLYDLIPSASSVKCDKSNTLTPSSLTCDVQRSEGTSVSRATSSHGTLRYRKNGDITSSTDGTALAINTGSVSLASTDTYVTFAFFDTNGTLRDKERVPVTKDGSDGEVYDIEFTEAWAKATSSGVITARLRGYAYKISGATRTRLAGATIRYGYNTQDSTTYASTTTNSSGYFTEDNWFDGDTLDDYAQGSSVVFAAIIIDGVAVCTKHVTIVQAAANGATGRMYYLAGEYTSKEYKRTSALCPVVCVITNGTTATYWYLDANTNNVGTSSSPVYRSPSDSGQSVWKQLQDFGAVLTDAIFVKEFAQFGAAIITKDWLISVHGTINGINYGGDVMNPEMYNNRPAYTFFDPLHPVGYDSFNVPLSVSQIDTTAWTKITNNFALTAGEYIINVICYVTASDEMYVKLYNGDNVYADLGTVTSENAIVLSYRAVLASSGAWNIRASMKENGGNGYFTSVQVLPQETRFIPNYALDLKTGRTYQSGLFVSRGQSTRIEIENGVMKFFGAFTYPNIVLGVDEDGCAVLNFYDKNGIFKYGLGPNQIINTKSQAESMTPMYYNILDDISATSFSNANIVTIYRYMTYSVSPGSSNLLYLYLAKISANVYGGNHVGNSDTLGRQMNNKIIKNGYHTPLQSSDIFDSGMVVETSSPLHGVIYRLSNMPSVTEMGYDGYTPMPDSDFSRSKSGQVYSYNKGGSQAFYADFSSGSAALGYNGSYADWRYINMCVDPTDSNEDMLLDPVYWFRVWYVDGQNSNAKNYQTLYINKSKLKQILVNAGYNL